PSPVRLSESALPEDDAGGDIIDAGFAITDPAPILSPRTEVPFVAAATGAAGLEATIARERASEILTELRDLLPRLSNPSGVDPVALANVLDAGILSDRMRWRELRAVMEAARDSPRDVETVLALSQRVNDVLALIDRHEELTAAVQRAAQQLRGQ
ncbi:MAG: hypothetical protein ACR2J8_11595, partial [Thermomicrobiales bacterium]